MEPTTIPNTFGNLGFLRFMSKRWPKAAEDPDVALQEADLPLGIKTFVQKADLRNWI
jgi:hypothetical protein